MAASQSPTTPRSPCCGRPATNSSPAACRGRRRDSRDHLDYTRLQEGSMTVSPPQELIDLGLNLVEASGAVLRRHFRAGLKGDIKGDGSPVTIADKETERAIREILDRKRPQDGIVGEEEGAKNKDAEYVWVIDPIDGTKPFMTGRPTFVTLLALLRNGKPIYGIIDQPISGERWIGIAGKPTTFNGKPVRTRACADLKSAVVYAGSVEFGEPGRSKFFRMADKASVTTIG